MTDPCVERTRSMASPDDLITNYELCMEDNKQNKRVSEGPTENPDSHMAVYLIVDEVCSEPPNYNSAGVAVNVGGIFGRNAPEHLVGDIFLVEKKGKPNGLTCNRITLSHRLNDLSFSNTEFLFTDLHRLDASSSIYLIINVFRQTSSPPYNTPSLQPYGMLCSEVLPPHDRKPSVVDMNASNAPMLSTPVLAKFYEVGGTATSMEEMQRCIICDERERKDKEVSSSRFLALRLAQKLKCDFNQLRNDPKYSRCTFVRSRTMPNSVPPDYQRDELIVSLDTFELRETKQGPVNLTQKKRIEVEMFLCDEWGKRFDSTSWKALPNLSNLTGYIPSEPNWRSHTSFKCKVPTWKEPFSIPLPTRVEYLNKFPPFIGFEAKYLSQNQWKPFGVAYLQLHPNQSSFQMLADKRHMLSLSMSPMGAKEYSCKPCITDSSGTLILETKLCSMTFTNNGHIYHILHPAHHLKEIPDSLKNFCKPLQVPPVEIQKFLIRLLHSLLEMCDTCWGDRSDLSNGASRNSKLMLTTEARKDTFTCILRVLHCIHQSGSEKQQRELQQYLDGSSGELKIANLINKERPSTCDIPVFLMNEMQSSAWSDDQFVQRGVVQRTETFSVMKVLSNLMRLICKLQELTLNLWRSSPTDYSFYETAFTDAVKRFFKYPEERLSKRAEMKDNFNALTNCEPSILSYLSGFGPCIDILYPVLPNEKFLQHLRCILHHTRMKQDILFTTITQNFLPHLIDSQTLFGGGFFEVGLPPLVWRCLKKAFSLNFNKVKKEKSFSEMTDMTERCCRYFRLFIRRLSQHWSRKQLQSKPNEDEETVHDETSDYDPVYESLLLSHNYKSESIMRGVEDSEEARVIREKALVVDKIRLLSDCKKDSNEDATGDFDYVDMPSGILRYIVRKLAKAIVQLDAEKKRLQSRKVGGTMTTSKDEALSQDKLIDNQLLMQYSAFQSITNTLAVSLFAIIPHLDEAELWMSLLGVDQIENNNACDCITRGSLTLYYCPFEERCLPCSTLRLVHVWDQVTELVNTCHLLCHWSPVPRISPSDALALPDENLFSTLASSISPGRWNDFTQQINKLIIQFISHFYPQVLQPLFFRCDANQSIARRCSVDVDSLVTCELVKYLCELLSSFYAQDYFIVPTNTELQNSVAEVTQLRLDTCRLMINIWNGLGGSKIHYIPDILPHMLPMLLPDVGEVRVQIVSMLFEMLLLNFETTKSLVIECIDVIIKEHVKHELVECLATNMENELQRHAGRSFPNKVEQEQFVKNMLEQITVLLEFHACFTNKEDHLPIFMSLNHLMRFYKKIGRSDLNERYLFILLNFYNKYSDLITEVGKLYFKLAKKYQWREEPLATETKRVLPAFLSYLGESTQAALKERLLEISLEKFEKWDFEMGWMVCSELQEHYKRTVQYDKLEEILKKQAGLINKIRNPTVQRPVHNYALITFVNASPLPSYIESVEGLLPSTTPSTTTVDVSQNPVDGTLPSRKPSSHSFIYRTLDSVLSVVELLKKVFPSHHVVHQFSDIKKHENCILLQGTIKPVPHIPDYMSNVYVSSRILSYYETNQTKQFVKEVHATGKNNATVFNSCTEITVETQRNFPGIFPIYPIVGCQNIERDSLHVALTKIRESLTELQSVYNEFKEDDPPQPQKTNKLRDTVHKFLLAHVQGGLRNYKEFKMTDEIENEKDSRMMELIECLRMILTLLYEAVRDLKTIPSEYREAFVNQLSALAQEMKEHFTLNLEHLRFYELKLEVKNSKSEVVYIKPTDQDKHSLSSNQSHSTLAGGLSDEYFTTQTLSNHAALSRSQMIVGDSSFNLTSQPTYLDAGPPPPRPRSPNRDNIELRTHDAPPIPRKPPPGLPTNKRVPHLQRDIARDSNRSEGMYSIGSSIYLSQQSQRESIVGSEDVANDNLYGTLPSGAVPPPLPQKKHQGRQLE